MKKDKAEADKAKQSRHETRSNATQDRIFKAAVRCLDTQGYSETTINGIQEEAGVSRGALTYHFPSKHDLMATTAMRLLEAASFSFEHQVKVTDAIGGSGSFREMVQYSWNNIVNTPEGRAFIEILMACRTDRELNEALESDIRKWEKNNAENIRERLQGASQDADDIIRFWSIMRTFLRGLLMHERFLTDPKAISKMVDMFADMAEGYFEKKWRSAD